MNVKYDYVIEELNTASAFKDLIYGEEESSIRFQTLMTCCFFAQIEEQIRFFSIIKTLSEDGETLPYCVAMIGIASNKYVALIITNSTYIDSDELREALTEIQNRSDIESPIEAHALASLGDGSTNDYFRSIGFDEEGKFHGNDG